MGATGLRAHTRTPDSIKWPRHTHEGQVTGRSQERARFPTTSPFLAGNDRSLQQGPRCCPCKQVEVLAKLVNFDQAETLSAGHGLGASLDGEFHKYVFDMRLHGLRRNAEVSSDFLVGPALADQLENGALAAAQ
jgi:hypothetical protein